MLPVPKGYVLNAGRRELMLRAFALSISADVRKPKAVEFVWVVVARLVPVSGECITPYKGSLREERPVRQRVVDNCLSLHRH